MTKGTNFAPSAQQGKLAKDMEKMLVQGKHGKKKILLAQCGPGAGKTTTLIHSFVNFEEKNQTLVEEMLEKEEKILVMVLANKDKKALEKAIKSKSLSTDLYHITTTHSLFFRFIPEIEKLGKFGISFELDYTQSKFTKNMIAYIIKSLCKGYEQDNKTIENMLGKKRFFEKKFLNANNIETAWSLVNGYFGSSHSFNQQEALLKSAAFFGKNDASWEDFLFSEGDERILNYIAEKREPKESISIIFFKMLISRVIELANMKEVVTAKIDESRKISFPVVIESNDEIPKVVNSFNYTTETKRVEVNSFHIMKVPHIYYTRVCYNTLIRNESIAKKLFEKTRIIVGDEFQDGNKALKDLTVQFLKWGVIDGVVGVGDEDQCIYAFSSSDHENILSGIKEDRKVLAAENIEVVEHYFPQTYRFGEQTATMLNHFFGTTMQGNKEIRDLVSPEIIARSSFAKKVTAISQKGTTAIICRSNAQCLDAYIALKQEGVLNVRLDNSAREEIKGFTKKGLGYIEDKHLKEEIADAVGISEESVTLRDMIASEKAKEILRENGWSSIAKLKIENIENFLVPEKGRKNIIEIGNPYIMKGSEFDSVIVADGFFSCELNNDGVNEDSHSLHNDAEDTSIFGEALKSLTKEEEPEEIIDKREEPSQRDSDTTLREILSLPKERDERNILFVTLSRAKKATYFLDTPLAHSIMADFPLDAELNKRREFAYTHKPEEKVEEAEEMLNRGLFAP